MIADTLVLVKIDTIYSVTRDTVISYNVPPQLMNQYTEILKSTNEQLSLSSNPLAIMIAALGILFTFLTILAAVLIFLQSSDFKRRVQALINRNETLIVDMINKRTEELEAIVLKYTQQIDDKSKDLESLGEIGGEQIAKKLALEAEIDELKTKKQTIQNEISKTLQVDSKYSVQGLNPSKSVHRCNNCGFGWIVDHPSPNFGVRGVNGPVGSISGTTHLWGTDKTEDKVVVCPKCGNVDNLPSY